MYPLVAAPKPTALRFHGLSNAEDWPNVSVSKRNLPTFDLEYGGNDPDAPAKYPTFGLDGTPPSVIAEA